MPYTLTELRVNLTLAGMDPVSGGVIVSTATGIFIESVKKAVHL